MFANVALKGVYGTTSAPTRTWNQQCRIELLGVGATWPFQQEASTDRLRGVFFPSESFGSKNPGSRAEIWDRFFPCIECGKDPAWRLQHYEFSAGGRSTATPRKACSRSRCRPFGAAGLLRRRKTFLFSPSYFSSESDRTTEWNNRGRTPRCWSSAILVKTACGHPSAASRHRPRVRAPQL